MYTGTPCLPMLARPNQHKATLMLLWRQGFNTWKLHEMDVHHVVCRRRCNM